MTTVILLRHGRTTAIATGVLAGWTPGVLLDEAGQAHVAAVADRLRPVPLVAVVTSPLERCRQTVEPIVASRHLDTIVDDRLGEFRYGDWTGRRLTELALTPLWKVVQVHPSAVVFPGPDGEALATVAARAVLAIRDWDARIAADHGPEAVWLACSHSDVIKAVLADALGLHLDFFQRIAVDPGSVSVIRYTETRPFLLRTNDTGPDLGWLVPSKRRRRRRASTSDAISDGT